MAPEAENNAQENNSTDKSRTTRLKAPGGRLRRRRREVSSDNPPGKIERQLIRVGDGPKENRERQVLETEFFDLAQNQELIDQWLESIGNLMWSNYYQNLTASERKGGYVFHCPEDEDWEGLEERIKAAEHFYILVNKDAENHELIGFVEMKPLDSQLVARMQHVKGEIMSLLTGDKPKKVTHLQLIVISDKYRGQGYGKKLHYHAREIAAQESNEVLLLEVPVVPDRNIRSLEFHENGLGMNQIAHTFEPEPHNPDSNHVFEIFVAGLKDLTKAEIQEALTPQKIEPRQPKKRPQQ